MAASSIDPSSQPVNIANADLLSYMQLPAVAVSTDPSSHELLARTCMECTPVYVASFPKPRARMLSLGITGERASRQAPGNRLRPWQFAGRELLPAGICAHAHVDRSPLELRADAWPGKVAIDPSFHLVET
jgi:hypothetical protein